MSRKIWATLLGVIILLFGFSSGWADSSPSGFYHTNGTKLLDGSGHEVFLRGIAFGNNVWFSSSLPITGHGEANYRELAQLGFNSTRFYLRADWFEGGKSENTFRWLDDNIALAKKHGIVLILNIHIPPGGFQSLGRGYALWENRDKQLKLIEVWKKIAQRYAAEPGIIGYGLLNEPWPTRNLGQWEKLAKELVAAIREADVNHVVVVEKPIVIGMDSLNDNLNGQLNFPLIQDKNVMYEFHFYLPGTFTHQNAAWLPTAGLYARYPDEGVAELCGNLPIETRFSAENTPLLPGAGREWTYFEGKPVTITDPALKIGLPVVRAERLGLGSVWFDDIAVEEYDADGTPVHNWNFDLNSPGFWLNNNLNALRPIPNQSRGGRNDSGSLALRGGKSITLSGATYLFNVKYNHTYKINGWIKANGASKAAKIALQLDFYASDGDVRPRNRSFIEGEMDRFVAFRNKVNAPVYLGEFGCIAYAFENNRGGLEWVSDVIDACKVRGIHYDFHDYYDDMFGLYNKYPTGSYTLNKGLHDLFQQKQTE